MSLLERFWAVPTRRLLGWGAAGLILAAALAVVVGAEAALRSRARWVPGEFVPVLRRRHRVLLPVSPEALSRGVVGLVPLLPDRGHALLGAHQLAGTLISREVLDERGVLPDGALAWLSSFVYNGTPRQLGVDFEAVEVASEVGPLPAWHVPAPSGGRDCVAVVVQGFGGHRAQGLRVLPALRRSGVASLFVTFRNAREAGRWGRGYQSFGEREAEDVVAALCWAQKAGYRRAVLYGFSMGGNAVLGALRPDLGPLPLPVSGVVLDSPALDWRDALRQNGRRQGLPPLLAGWLGRAVEWLIVRRSGQDFDRVDQLAAAPGLRVPTLLFHGTRDRTIHIGPSEEFAARRPDLVEYHRVEGAKHIRCWNVDPARYDMALEDFLARVLAGVPA